MTKRADAPSPTWKRAAAAIAWLGAIIAPALTFDIATSYSSDIDFQFGAFFLIVITILYLVVGATRLVTSRKLLPLWIALAVLSFVAFSLLRQDWTCDYFGEVRIVHGTSYTAPARTLATQRGLRPDDYCQMLRLYGGDAVQIWSKAEVIQRFLLLFASYSLAWTMLAAAVLGAVRGRSGKARES